MKQKFSQRGFATLTIAMALLIAMTYLVLFSAQSSYFEQKMNANSYKARQAFEAAQAGLDLGIVNFLNSPSSIVNNNGTINADNATFSGTLPNNNSTYEVTYSSIQNSPSIIQITSIGKNDDTTAQHTVAQQFILKPAITTDIPTLPLTSVGTVSLTGNVRVSNTTSSTSKTIWSGSSVTLSGSVDTVTASGVSSTANNPPKSDIVQSANSLSNLTSSEFFKNVFGMSMPTYQSLASTTFSNSTNTNYNSQLNGLQNQFIYINQTNNSTASLSGNTVIGSATKPIVLVVNGALQVSGNVAIYGIVFSSSSTQASGNVSINGALMSGSTISASGSAQVTYNSSILNAIKNNIGSYTKLGGSWQDLGY